MAATADPGLVDASGPGSPGRWVLLAYRVPREPSTPRIAIWRGLKRLGVAQLADGLVALPADTRTREQLEWVAQDVLEAAGSAGVWLAQPTTAAQERQLARAMMDARAAEYASIVRQAQTAMTAGTAGTITPVQQAGIARRLRGELRRIMRRDYFPPAEREAARIALEALTRTVHERDQREQRGQNDQGDQQDQWDQREVTQP